MSIEPPHAIFFYSAILIPFQSIHTNPLFVFSSFLPTGPSFWPPINIHHAKASSRCKPSRPAASFSFFFFICLALHITYISNNRLRSMKENSPPAKRYSTSNPVPCYRPPNQKFSKEYDSYTCTTQVSTTSRPLLLAAIQNNTRARFVSAGRYQPWSIRHFNLLTMPALDSEVTMIQASQRINSDNDEATPILDFLLSLLTIG